MRKAGKQKQIFSSLVTLEDTGNAGILLWVITGGLITLQQKRESEKKARLWKRCSDLKIEHLWSSFTKNGIREKVVLCSRSRILGSSDSEQKHSFWKKLLLTLVTLDWRIVTETLVSKWLSLNQRQRDMIENMKPSILTVSARLDTLVNTTFKTNTEPDI